MSFTKSTPNLHLPQYEANNPLSIPEWNKDITEAFATIDEAISESASDITKAEAALQTVKEALEASIAEATNQAAIAQTTATEAKNSAESANSKAIDAQNTANGIAETANQANETANTANETANTAEATANQANALANMFVPKTKASYRSFNTEKFLVDKSGYYFIRCLKTSNLNRLSRLILQTPNQEEIGFLISFYDEPQGHIQCANTYIEAGCYLFIAENLDMTVFLTNASDITTK